MRNPSTRPLLARHVAEIARHVEAQPQCVRAAAAGPAQGWSVGGAVPRPAALVPAAGPPQVPSRRLLRGQAGWEGPYHYAIPRVGQLPVEPDGRRAVAAPIFSGRCRGGDAWLPRPLVQPRWTLSLG